jgi:hypothetical protein
MDDDIISQGGDRAPAPRSRRLVVIAAIVAVAVIGGAAYLSLPGRQHAPVAAHPTPVPSGSAALSLPPEPDGIAGQAVAWDRGLRLLAAGAQPAWFSPASGRAELIGGLPASRPGYRFTRVVGGWAVQAAVDLPAGCGSCAGPAAPVWFLSDGARSATRLGTANLVAPGATAGAVWLTSYPVGADMSTVSGTAREAGAASAAGRPVRLPPGYAIGQGTIRGLLLTPVSQQPGAADELWEPSAPAASTVVHGVLAASPGEIAWSARCPVACVRVLNLATGTRTEVALPAGSSAGSAAFSPDGGFLALELSSGGGGDSGGLAMQLEVASVASGRLAPVPGTWVSSDALIGFGWPAADDALVAEFSFTTKMQLTSWHPGASRAAVTILAPGGSRSSLILG